MPQSMELQKVGHDWVTVQQNEILPCTSDFFNYQEEICITKIAKENIHQVTTLPKRSVVAKGWRRGRAGRGE